MIWEALNQVFITQIESSGVQMFPQKRDSSWSWVVVKGWISFIVQCADWHALTLMQSYCLGNHCASSATEETIRYYHRRTSCMYTNKQHIVNSTCVKFKRFKNDACRCSCRYPTVRPQSAWRCSTFRCMLRAPTHSLLSAHVYWILSKSAIAGHTYPEWSNWVSTRRADLWWVRRLIPPGLLGAKASNFCDNWSFLEMY